MSDHLLNIKQLGPFDGKVLFDINLQVEPINVIFII